MIPIDTIVVPQGAEYQAVCRGLKKAHADLVRVIAIPMGTTNIELTLTRYSSELTNAHNILIMGLCGSLTQKYTVGDIALYKSCRSLNDVEINLDFQLTTAIEEKLSVRLVAGLTCDRVIFQASEKLRLGNTYHASVVDMEGYGYVKKLQQPKVSVAMLRVVSDSTSGDIPDLSSAIDAAGNLKTTEMAIAFIKQPIAAIRLIRGSLIALNKLQQITYQLTMS